MSQINQKTISEVRQVRNQLAALQPDDQDTLIQVGSELEAILGQIPEDMASANDAVMSCLQGLQAIFHGDVRSFPALITVLTATMVAVEQVLGAPTSPVAGGMLSHTFSLLQTELGGTAAEPAGDEPTIEAETEHPELTTLDDIATLLVQIDACDISNLNHICEALKVISGQTESAEVRKLLVKAAREVSRIVAGKAKNVEEMMDSVANLIDQANQSDRDETVKKGEIEEPVDVSEIDQAIPEEPQVTSPPKAIESYEPDVLAADCDLAIVGEFVVESGEMLEAAESSLLTLETDPGDIESVNTVFRAFHTVKGSAAYLGLKRLAELAHLAESLLSRMRDQEIRCTGGYANLALHSIDTLKEMLADLNDSIDGGTMHLPESYADLIHVLSNPEAAGVSAEIGNKPVITQSKETRGLGTSDDPTRLGDILVSMKAEQVESLAENQGDSLIGEMLVDAGLASPDDISNALQVQTRLRSDSKQVKSESSVRVRTDRLDRLIDIVGELVIAQSMLTQDATVMQSNHHELSRKISHAGKIVRELQDLSMGMRMIPLRGTFQKMTRLVRDVAQKCGKQVEFVTEGEDTEIDRNMVDLIADPLVHMVRNAVDHGIERPEVREAGAKPVTGTIRLAAYHAGGDVVVELRDDGAGIDRDVILAKALAKNLIETDKGLSETQIFNLIFAPGFSTAEQVTAVSGRGVGMDVVRRNIEAMRGRIEISSEKGKGSVFTVRLPLTLAITDGMLVRVGTERFIVPIVNIQLSFQPTPAMLSTVTGRGELVSLRGELMPIFRLHQLFSVKNAVEQPTQGLLMIVADGRRRCALLVDELLGQQQVVAKNLGQGMGKIPGVSGGAILGDGCIGLILDTPELVALARQNKSVYDRREDAQEVLAA